MTVSDKFSICSDVEGLFCLSDLAPDLTGISLEKSLCTVEEPCLHFFLGMGFRPAAWVMNRDQYGDRPLLIVSGDDAYFAKYDGPFDAFAFLPELPVLSGLPARGKAPLLAVPTSAASGETDSIIFPGFPHFSGGGGHNRQDMLHPGTPSGPIRPGGASLPDLPPLAPVPLSSSGMFLILALGLMLVKLAKRSMGTAPAS